MTLLLLNRKLVMTTSIAVLVVVISASAVAAWLSSERLRADDTHPLSNIMLERGVAIGQGWLNGSDSDIAAYVNEIPVSTAEFYEEQARARTYLDIALDRLDRAVSDEEYGAFIFEYIERQEQLGPGGTVEIPLFDGESPIPESTAAIIRTRIKVVQDHGVDTMALAVLIERYAFLSAAREAGFSAPELEVQGRVAERRTLFESVDVEPIQPVFPILGAFRLNGQPKRDDGMIFGSYKASQSPVYPIRDAILAVNHASCPSLSSSGSPPMG